MSLDVSLFAEKTVVKPVSSGIFIRENGQNKEISHNEWNARFPDKDPVKLHQVEVETDEVYSANITHNLGNMANEAGIYKHLWRPDEIGITKAKELIDPLREGLHKLKSEPEKYKKFNPENGWGSYEGLISFIQNYLDACYQHPDASVEVSR